eukprot:3332899-Pleurochrysis_carterae.AAC.1
MSIECFISERFLQWTLSQHAGDEQYRVTLQALSKCGCDENTVSWLEQQVHSFLHDGPLEI